MPRARCQRPMARSGPNRVRRGARGYPLAPAVRGASRRPRTGDQRMQCTTPRADRALRRRPRRHLSTAARRSHRARALVTGVAAMAALTAPGCADDGGGATDGATPATAPGTTAPLLPTTATTPVDGALGPTSLPDPTGTVPVVLTETVSAARSGPWWALGLVRNDGPGPVGPLTVTAVLVGGSGELDRVSTEVPVAVVGPGEPAPFRIASDVTAEGVTEVRWEVTAPPADGPATSVDVAVFWTRPFGAGQPVSVPGYEDPVGGPLPFVLYGSVTNTGAASLAAPAVVAAWMDDDGRVSAVAEAPVLVAGTAEPAPELAPGAALDVVIAVDDPQVGPSLEEARPMFWGITR